MKRIHTGALINYLFITIMGFITLYPFIYIVSVSISPISATMFNRVILLPKGFTTTAYEAVFKEKKLLMSFFNSVQYTFAGTVLSIFLTTLTAYPLAQPKFKKYAQIYMRFVVFTMLFSGGLIPTYLVIRSLKMINTFWVMIIPGAISSFYLILTKTFMQQLPIELYEAAEIEGSGDFDKYLRIVLPLSKPIIACISLYYAVGIWNSYMTPLIYLISERKYPLQIYLRQLILQSMAQEMEIRVSGSESMTWGASYSSESIKAAVLVISTIPILIVYPFLQKYFITGIMVGAIKG